MELITKQNNLQIKSPALLVRTTAAYGLVTTVRGGCAHHRRGWYSLAARVAGTLLKKKRKFSSYIRKIQKGSVEKLYVTNGLLWLNICAFPHILGNLSSYMTLQLDLI